MNANVFLLRWFQPSHNCRSMSQCFLHMDLGDAVRKMHTQECKHAREHIACRDLHRRMNVDLSSSTHKGTEDILVRREPEHITMDVLPASLLVVVQHCSQKRVQAFACQSKVGSNTLNGTVLGPHKQISSAVTIGGLNCYFLACPGR